MPRRNCGPFVRPAGGRVCPAARPSLRTFRPDSPVSLELWPVQKYPYFVAALVKARNRSESLRDAANLQTILRRGWNNFHAEDADPFLRLALLAGTAGPHPRAGAFC